MLGALAFVVASGSALITDRDRPWTAHDSTSCLLENVDPTPAVLAEREERLPSDSVLRVDVAAGIFGGLGAPGGVGGYLGHTREGTPGSAGWSGWVRGDLVAFRPLWVSAQAHVLSTPSVHATAFMTDVFVGYDLYGQGNSFTSTKRKHSSERVYTCAFGRWDVAFVTGRKSVRYAGERTLDEFDAWMGGVQLRVLRSFRAVGIGIDFDVLGVYDPALRSFGAEARDVLHVGSFVFTQSIGAIFRRGAWGTLGVGGSFEI